MPRAPRRESITGIHHVMNRGVDHQDVFFADVDRIEFGRRLAALHDEHGVATLAYCLMSNHYHLLLRSPTGGLPDAMKHLSSVYTRHTNDRLGRDGPLFRGRYHSIPVETDAYLLAAARYIHRNPLDLPGVDAPQHYRWSSYRACVGLRPAAPFLDLEPVTSLSGGRAAVAASTEDDGGRWTPTTAADLRQLVAYAVATDDLTCPSDDVPRRWLDRTVITLLADRCSDPVHGAVLAAAVGHRSVKAMALATDRARRRFDADPTVRRIVSWLEAELGTVRV